MFTPLVIIVDWFMVTKFKSVTKKVVAHLVQKLHMSYTIVDWYVQ